MYPSAPRYTKRAFPPYRYVPGRDPHPTAHPNGHSYLPPGHPHPRPPYFPPDRWPEDEEYLYGCDLYNHGYWWEAHEAWEGIWQQTDKAGTQGLFLQGLIQAAACHLKRHTGHAEGVARLRAGVQRLLGAVDRDLRECGAEPRFMGLDVSSFVDLLDAYYAGIGAASRPHDPETFPYVQLISR